MSTDKGYFKNTKTKYSKSITLKSDVLPKNFQNRIENMCIYL